MVAKKHEYKAAIARAMLQTLGWKEDAWGNWVEPGGKRRYHFQSSVVNLQAKKVTGGWFNARQLKWSDFDGEVDVVEYADGTCSHRLR